MLVEIEDALPRLAHVVGGAEHLAQLVDVEFLSRHVLAGLDEFLELGLDVAPVVFEVGVARPGLAAESHTGEGMSTKWTQNDDDRGYKLLQVYRMDCPDSPRIQLRIADRDGAVTCVEAGLATDEELNSSCDYVMFAKTERWLEMGAGKYGPMVGMMTGRLKFQGPKWEAMKNMGPFKSFLQLVQVNPGFQAEGVLTMQVSLPRDTYPDGPALQRFHEQVSAQLAGIPGVTSAGVANPLPFGPGG